MTAFKDATLKRNMVLVSRIDKKRVQKEDMRKSMKETIIFGNYGNETEMLRTLSKFGKKRFALRLMDRMTLLDYLLPKLNIVIEEEVLSLQQEVLLYQKVIQDKSSDPLIAYFKNSKTYQDVLSIVSGIHKLRETSVADLDESCKAKLRANTFGKKNESVLRLYELYRKERGVKLDENDLLFLVISKAKKLDNVTFKTLSCYPYSECEKKLVEILTGEDFAKSQINLPSENGKPSAYGVYGEYNETLNALKIINEKGWPLDECEIVVLDGKRYYPYLVELKDLLDVKLTFGTGIPLSSTRVGALLKSLYNYETFDRFGPNWIKEVFNGRLLDLDKIMGEVGLSGNPKGGSILQNVLKVAGNLRLCFNKSENDKAIKGFDKVDENCLDSHSELPAKPYLRSFACVLEKGYAGILEDYFEPRSPDEASAKSTVLSFLRNLGGEAKEYVPYLLSKNVAFSNSEEGSLHITTLENALFSLRKHIFVLGLSSDNFPRSESEDFVALDEDLKTVCPSARQSVQKQEEDKKLLSSLISLGYAMGCETVLSYSSYDVDGVRKRNMSSFLYDFNVTKIDSFFDSGFLDKYGNEYLKGTKINAKANHFDEPKYIPDAAKIFNKDHPLSPSKLENLYLNKDSRLDFLTGVIFEAPFEEETETYQYMNQAEFGNLMHAVFQHCNYPLKLSELEKDLDKRLSDFELTHRPLVDKAPTKAKAKRQLKNGCEMLKDFTPIDREKELMGEIDGIYFKGRCDMIATKCLENYVVDYKTGKVKHNDGKAENAIQGLVYADLKSTCGTTIKKVDFAYFSVGSVIEYGSSGASAILDDFKIVVQNLAFKSDKITSYNPWIDID